MAAQRELVIDHGTVVSRTREQWDGFRSVDMDHPLSNIWKSRKQRHQHNLARLAIEGDKRRKEAEDAALLERRQYRAKTLMHVVKQVGGEDFWKAIREVHNGGPDTR